MDPHHFVQLDPYPREKSDPYLHQRDPRPSSVVDPYHWGANPDPCIRTSFYRIRIRIPKAPKHTDRTDPDPEHCLRTCLFQWSFRLYFFEQNCVQDCDRALAADCKAVVKKKNNRFSLVFVLLVPGLKTIRIRDPWQTSRIQQHCFRHRESWAMVEEALHCGMDQISIKTPNPKCRLYCCIIEFIDWR
jgi:hypothetical protein